MLGFFDRNNTFRKRKEFEEGSRRHSLYKQAQASLELGELKEAVKLPEGEDLNEWLAVNTIDFYNKTNLLYGWLAEFCKEDVCPTMSAGPQYEYFWADEKQKKVSHNVNRASGEIYLVKDPWIEREAKQHRWKKCVTGGEETPGRKKKEA